MKDCILGIYALSVGYERAKGNGRAEYDALEASTIKWGQVQKGSRTML